MFSHTLGWVIHPAKSQTCLTQRAAETGEAGFQLLGHCVSGEREGETHIQLVVNIGSILQQGVHHLGVSILRCDGESRATVLP